jgi:hypothetical protein
LTKIIEVYNLLLQLIYLLIDLQNSSCIRIRVNYCPLFPKLIKFVSKSLKAICSNSSLLRNVLEKTATFLGYQKWGDLLPQVNGAPDPFAARIINLSSHSAHSGEEVAQLEANDKDKLVELVEHLFAYHHFRKQETQHD